MQTLRIHLLGPLEFCRGEECVSQFATAKVQQLLGYLLIHRRKRLSRDALAALFWGDTPDELARGSLRTSLWRLRGALEPDASLRGSYLVVARNGIGFNTSSDYWLDLQEFEDASEIAGQEPPRDSDSAARMIHRLKTAIDLYRGDFLDGCYEDWCIFERERVRELFLRNLIRLMMLHRDGGNYTTAIQVGQQLLSRDPLLEEVHRELMRLHCLAGNRGAAIRQYQQCRQLLAKELDIEPMDETRDLNSRIMASNETPGSLVDALLPGRRLPSPLESALNELQSVQRELDRAQDHLRRGVAGVESLRQDVSISGDV